MKSTLVASPNSFAYDEYNFLVLFLHEFIAVYGSTVFVDDSRSIMQDTSPEHHNPEWGVPFRVIVSRNLSSDAKKNLKMKFDNFLSNFYGAHLPNMAQKIQEQIASEKLNYTMLQDKLSHADYRYGIDISELERLFELCENESDAARITAKASITSSLHFEKRNLILKQLDDSSRYITDLYNRLNCITRINSAKYFVREIVQGKGIMRLYVRN